MRYLLCLILVINNLWNVSAKSYSFESVANDPLETRIYTLANGLKIYLSVNKKEPNVRMHTIVKAGSKNDPADATGLAHYLEHLLFKGTQKLGTKNYTKEKLFLDKIDSLYVIYGKTIDSDLRKNIYHKIDSISTLAAQFALPNEFDKLTKEMGVKSLNAYTSNDQTVYMANIPSNQLEKYLRLEAERFQQPVFRLFHTELEVVYEEKNRTLDNDNRKSMEVLLANLFPHHPYGTQTTIGTIDHLKNPSLQKIREFFNTYYVPNNMAIAIAGDLDPDQTIAWIDQYFGSWKNKPITEHLFPIEKPITQAIEKTVNGPNSENLKIAFRFKTETEQERACLILTDMLLSNGKAGLIDLNINQNQKALSAWSGIWELNDYQIHLLGGEPKTDQNLNDLKKILLNQIEEIKQGHFNADLLPAIIGNFKKSELQKREHNDAIVSNYTQLFIQNISLEKEVNWLNTLSKISKAEIIDFVKKNYHENYVIIYKKQSNESNNEKIEKPIITPIQVERNEWSTFAQSIKKMPINKIEPVFLDFKQDLQKDSVLPLYFVPNKRNDLYTLGFKFKIGSNHLENLKFLPAYLNYLGTKKYAASELKEKWYQLSNDFFIFVNENESFIYLTGLQENLSASLDVMVEILTNAQNDSIAWKNLQNDILRSKENNKNDKTALFYGGIDYAKFGEKNPSNTNWTTTEIKAIKANEILATLPQLLAAEYEIFYFGKENDFRENLKKIKIFENNTVYKPFEKYQEIKQDSTKIYLIHYPMTQAEIQWIQTKENFDNHQVPVSHLFNHYFGNGMSSVVFQEIREAKALAYSAWAHYSMPDNKQHPFVFNAYIGTQADKMPEAITAMNDLINHLQFDKNRVATTKRAIQEEIKNERINDFAILKKYQESQKFDTDQDMRKWYYQAGNINQKELENFYKKNIKNQKYQYVIIADTNKIDQDYLKKLGEIKILTPEMILGE